MPNRKDNLKKDSVSGVAAALGAYILWGFLPIYWKSVQAIPATQIIAHRIVWSFIFLVGVLILSGKVPSFIKETRSIFAQPKQAIMLVLAVLLLTSNWLTYIWAVNAEHVVDASLGYYINPLVSIVLAIIVLKEKLSFWGIISFGLAAIGVLTLTIYLGDFPWIALILAFSFGLYGLIKKLLNLGALTGLTLETMVIAPPMFLYLIYLHSTGHGFYGTTSPAIMGLLTGGGIATAVPLILFGIAANRLSLLAIGFLQYLSPTIMLVLGVFVYHEPFTKAQLFSFILIWIALAIFSLSGTKPFKDLESRFLARGINDDADQVKQVL